MVADERSGCICDRWNREQVEMGVAKVTTGTKIQRQHKEQKQTQR